MRQYEIPEQYYIHLVLLNQVTNSMCYLSRVSWLFPCSLKRFLYFRLSSIRLLIKWFLIKNRVAYKAVSFKRT